MRRHKKLSTILAEGLLYGVLLGVFAGGIIVFGPIAVGGFAGFLVFLGILGIGCLIRLFEAGIDGEL